MGRLDTRKHRVRVKCNRVQTKQETFGRLPLGPWLVLTGGMSASKIRLEAKEDLLERRSGERRSSILHHPFYHPPAVSGDLPHPSFTHLHTVQSIGKGIFQRACAEETSVLFFFFPQPEEKRRGNRK
ncbi:hypothetical protein CDAR_604051 [Caerostris darwini]|uniref:Uncharacterized protein n=1 Tax=Caerostris darwini TaxID=1538125 RepID=A0AAV4REV6_9ARAC|nr:hypothetical protein CDAR_604051 [Caerostris darwini]